MPSFYRVILALLVVAGVLSLTAIVVAVLRQRDGAAARHYANLTLPLGLMPLLAALCLDQPRAALASVVLIVAVLAVTSTAEAHIVGRLTFLSRRRRVAKPEKESQRRATESLER